MRCDRADLFDIAERIDAHEGRLAKLKLQLERLRAEGSDTTRARGLLETTRRNLGQLYSKQMTLRRCNWGVGSFG
jgi:uncharacterized protein Veg